VYRNVWIIYRWIYIFAWVLFDFDISSIRSLSSPSTFGKSLFQQRHQWNDVRFKPIICLIVGFLMGLVELWLDDSALDSLVWQSVLRLRHKYRKCFDFYKILLSRMVNLCFFDYLYMYYIPFFMDFNKKLFTSDALVICLEIIPEPKIEPGTHYTCLNW